MAINTSIQDTFKRNFIQVADAILRMAAKVRGKKPLVDQLLQLLEKDPMDDDNTEGNLSLNITVS